MDNVLASSVVDRCIKEKEQRPEGGVRGVRDVRGVRPPKIRKAYVIQR